MVYLPGTQPQRLHDSPRAAISGDKFTREDSSTTKDIKPKGPFTADTSKGETADFCVGVSEDELDAELEDKPEPSIGPSKDSAVEPKVITMAAQEPSVGPNKDSAVEPKVITMAAQEPEPSVGPNKDSAVEPKVITMAAQGSSVKGLKTEPHTIGVAVGGKTQSISSDHGFRGPFICKICDKILASKTNLRIHMEKKHIEEKAYKCGVCAKGFTERSMLRRHKVVVHMRRCDNCLTYVSEVDPWTEPGITSNSHRHIMCGQCQNTVIFTSVNKSIAEHELTNDLEELKKLERVQIDERDIIPEEENFEAVRQITDGLDEKPVVRRNRKGTRGYSRYCCVICKKLYSNSSDVLRHQMTHYTEKQFMCDTCGVTVRSNSVLLTHRKLHTEIKIYPCKLCGKRYRNKTSVIDHMCRKHQIYDMKHAEVECSDIYTVDSGMMHNVKLTDSHLVVDGEVIVDSGPSTSMI